MKKADLIKFLEEARLTEESATTIYLQHLDAFSKRFEISEEFKKEADRIIKSLIEGNKHHKKLCEQFLEELKGEEKDDI